MGSLSLGPIRSSIHRSTKSSELAGLIGRRGCWTASLEGASALFEQFGDREAVAVVAGRDPSRSVTRPVVPGAEAALRLVERHSFAPPGELVATRRVDQGMRNTITATLAVAVALLGGALAASPAQAANAAIRTTVKVCAHGNYTAYAKVVDSSGAAIKLTEVPSGACHTDSVLINSGAYKVWFFGLYNVSHKGFNVRADNGAWLFWTTGNPGLYLEALGETTAPRYQDGIIWS